MPYAQLPGERIFYAEHRPQETEEELPVVICIHGAGGSHLSWPPELRRLAGARVLVLDLPGHGRSTGAGRQTIDEYVALLLAFIDSLQLSPAIIMGHSMGGAIAQQMTLAHPDRVRGLVLLGSGARLRVAPAILQGILDDFESAIEIICEWAYGPDTPDDLTLSGRQMMAQTSPQVMHGDFLACDTFDIMPRLNEIDAPTLVITGSADRLTPPKYANTLAENIPAAKLVLVENAGHMVMLERPQEVASAVARFLSSL